MDLLEAQEVIKDMLDTAAKDAVTLALRIDELKAEFAEDPFEGTEAQIQRLEVRRDKKIREANALAVVASSF